MESMELSEELDDTEPIDARRGRSIDRSVETSAGSLSLPLDWFLISGRLAGVEAVFWLLLVGGGWFCTTPVTWPLGEWGD